MMQLKQDIWPQPPAPDKTVPDKATLEFLDRLRRGALDCRAKPKADLFKACALLSLDRNSDLAEFMNVLILSLSQNLGVAPVFFRPETKEISFDEAWLIRLFQSSANGDDDSFSFLIRSRTPKTAHRNLGFLIGSISDQICLL